MKPSNESLLEIEKFKSTRAVARSTNFLRQAPTLFLEHEIAQSINFADEHRLNSDWYEAALLKSQSAESYHRGELKSGNEEAAALLCEAAPGTMLERFLSMPDKNISNGQRLSITTAGRIFKQEDFGSSIAESYEHTESSEGYDDANSRVQNEFTVISCWACQPRSIGSTIFHCRVASHKGQL